MMNSLRRIPILLLFVFSWASTMGTLSTGTVIAAEPAQLKAPEVEVLANGLQIAWFADPKVPLIDIGLQFWAGTVDDAEGKSGTAQLLSSCLFRGAAGLNAKQLALATERLGASRYSSSSEETFGIGFHGLSEDAPELLTLLAKVALHPDLPEQEVQEQKARMLDRWRHVGEYGDSVAGLAFSRRLTAGTPYGRGSFVSLGELQKLSRSDLLAYHQKHFRPEKAILLVSGRFDREKLRPIILKELFGEGPDSWAMPATSDPRAARLRKPYSEPRLARVKERIIGIHRPQLNQAAVRFGFHAPLLTSPDHYPLMVLNALLGEHFNSRLNLLLRDRLGLTYSAGSSLSFDRDLTVFYISSNTKNESAAELISKTLQVLKEVHEGKITKEEVETAKEYLTGSFAIASATPSSAVSRWLMGKMFELGPKYLNEYVPKVRAVTVEDVIAAARKHMKPGIVQVTIAGNMNVIEPKLKTEKLPPMRRVPLEDLL